MKLRAAILAAISWLWAAPVFSQGCAMCYSTAKATSKDGQRAISKGVIVLLVPPMGIMTLGLWIAFRYGKKRDLDQDESFEGAELLEISDFDLPNTMNWCEPLPGSRSLPVG
jgi:hypothetical protein